MTSRALLALHLRFGDQPSWPWAWPERAPAWCLAAMLAAALLVATLPPLWSAGLLAAVAVALLVLARPALGLALLALAVPFGSLLEERLGGVAAGPTEALVGLVAAGWLAATLTRQAGRVSFGPLFRPLFGLTLAFLGAGLLAASFAATSAGRLDIPVDVPVAASAAAAAKELLRWVELLVVFVVATDLLRDERHLRLVLGAVLVAGVGQALLGATQFFGRLGPPSFQVGPFLRAYGTFGQPNPYAGYLGMVLPLTLALAATWRPAGRDWLRRLGWAALALVGAALAMSMSRGGWLGAAVAGGVVALLASRRAAPLLAGAAGLGAGLLGLNALGLLPAVVAQRLAPVLENFRIFDTRGVYPFPEIWPIVERMAHWQAAWEMLVDHPLVGVGPGHYVLAYPAYAILPYWTDPLGHAHNIYLNVAAEGGLLGLVAYLAMLAGWLTIGVLSARRLSRTAPAGLRRALAVGVVASLAAAAMHNLFDNLYVHGLNVHVGLLLGLVASSGVGFEGGAATSAANGAADVAAR